MQCWRADGSFENRLPEVAALRGVPQPAEYHREGDALAHTLLAMEAVEEGADERVFWGALLHDVGKRETTKLIDGRWRAFGHAEAGAKIVPPIMDRIGLHHLANDVAWLVKNHLFHFSWQLTRESRLSKRQERFMENPLFPLLLQVCSADAAASLGANDKGDTIRLVAALFKERKSSV